MKRKLQKEGKLGKQELFYSRVSSPANPFALLTAAQKRNFAASPAFSTIASISASTAKKSHALSAAKDLEKPWRFFAALRMTKGQRGSQ